MVEKLKPEVMMVIKVIDAEIKNIAKINSSLEIKFQLINQVTGKFVHQSDNEILNKAWRIYSEVEKYDRDFLILKAFSSDLIELGSANIHLGQGLPIKQMISIQENGEEIIDVGIEIILQEINEESLDILTNDLENSEENKADLNLKIEKSIYFGEKPINNNIITPDDNDFQSISQKIDEAKVPLFEEQKNEAPNLGNIKEQSPLDQLTECRSSFTQDYQNENLYDLQQKIQEGFAKYQINNKEQLLKKIEDCKKYINLWNKKGNYRKEKEQEEILTELNKLFADLEKVSINYETFENEKIDSDKISEINIEEEFKLGLEKYKIKNVESLFEKIKETQADIESFKELGEQESVDEEEKTLEELKHFCLLYNQLVDKILKERESNYIQSKIKFLDDLYEDTESMPWSLEKHLSKILCYFSLKSFKFIIPEMLLQKINQIDIDQEFEILNEEARKFDTKIDYGLVDNLKKYSKNQSWDDAVRLIKETITNLSPINFKELFRLIEKSKIATENLENKDIILLIGSTGCGKSTTVHFLAGSILTKIIENGVEHIVPIVINDKVLKKVNVSNLNQSETKNITAVKIPTESEIFVCDTPGLMDTAGAEVDIANTRGIVNAIQKCKSVRPIILISGKDEGGRFQGFENLAHSLAKFCPGLKKHSQSFAYAFTRYEKNEIKNIHGRINNSINKIHDSFTRDLIADIEEKTRGNINVISPLTDDPEDILHKILEITPINDPENIFNCFLTVESRDKIEIQIEVYKGEIETALRIKDYFMIKDRLDDLKTLSSLFKEYKDKYNNCVNSVIEGTKEVYNSAIMLFNSSVHEKNVLLKDTVEAYKRSFNEIKESEKIREDHLKGKTPSSEEFLNNIEQQLKLNEKNDIENFEIEVAKAKLKNLSLIAEIFEEFNGKNSELKLIYENFIIEMIKKAEKSFEIKDFNLCSNQIKEVKAYLKNIGGYLNLSDLDIKYQKLLEIIKSCILALVGNLAPLYAKDKIEENDIDIIINYFGILSNIKEIDVFKDIIDIENLDSSIKYAIEQYFDHYNKLDKKILDIIRDKDAHSLSAAKAIFEEMELLMKISEVETKVRATHKRLIFEIERKMTNFRSSIKEILNDFASSERIDFNLLSNSLSGLKEGEWIERICPGACESELDKINEEIIKFVDKIDSKFKDIDLNIEHSSSIKIAFDIVNQMKSLETLKEFIPSLEKKGESYYIQFEGRINQVLNEIKAEFLNEIEESKSSAEDQNNLETNALEENYHEDMDEFKIPAKEEEKQIKSTNTKENINWTKANYSLNYLKICKEISFINSEDLWMKFTEFLQKNWQQIHQSFQAYFDIIERFIHKESLTESQCKEASQGLYSAFEKGIDLRNKAQSIMDYLECRDILEEYNTKINRIEQELFNTSEHYKHENQINQYYLSLLIFESLSLIDQITANKTTFSKRFSEIQNEFCKQISETEKHIITCIDNCKFSEAEILINNLDKLKRRRNFRIISNKIQSIIVNLMGASKFCLDRASIKIEDENINKVVENQKNIKRAKETIFSYVDEEVKLSLVESEVNFYNFFADKIKKWIKRIEHEINKYSYCDAETFIGNLEKICPILSYSEITSPLGPEIFGLKTRIKNLPQSIPENFDKIPIESYKDFISPKHIIKELEKAAQQNPNFTDCIEKIKQIVNKKIESIEEEMSKSNYYDKKQKIKSIENIYQILPKEIENNVKLKIKEWKKNLKINKEDRAILLEIATKDKDIEKLCQIIIDDMINKRGSKSINDSKCKLKDVLNLIIDEACNALKQNNLELALEKAAIYEHYQIIWKALGIDGKNLIDKKLGKEINKKFEDLCRCLWNINDEKINIIVSNWKDFQRIVEFNIKLIDQKNGSRLDFLDRLTQSTYSSLSGFFVNIYINYNRSKPPNNTRFSNYYLDKIKEYDILLQSLKEFKFLHCKSYDNEEFGEEYYYDDNPIELYLKLSYCQNYSEISDELNNEFSGIASYLKNFTVQDDEINHEKILDDRFKSLKENFRAMKKFGEIESHILNFSQIYDECISWLKAEIDKVKQNTFECINKDDFLDTDYAKLRIGYRLLYSFKSSINIEGIDLTEWLNKIENTFKDKAKIHEIIASNPSSSTSNAIKSLISIKTISINFPPMKEWLDKLIDKLLVQFKKGHNSLKVRAIYDELEKENTGLIIINEHKFFETEKHRLWAERTEISNIDYVMERIDGSNIDKTALAEHFIKYNKFYKKISSKYIGLTSDSSIGEAIDALSALICSKFSTIDFDSDFMCSKKNLNTTDKKIIPKLLAYLASLWTLLNIKKANPDLNENNNKIILSPHPVQILSIFRIVGIGYSSQTTFGNNLIQILTGEGKSVTLGLTSAMLAILGFSVSCACYSEHLSKRDHNEFSQLFNWLNISYWISYGTFNELCENEINRKIDIRKFVKNEIYPKSENAGFRTYSECERPRILLIDEVDVFFSKTFYGKMYRPCTTLKNDLVTNLINLIWSRRKGNLNLIDIFKSQEFIKCRSFFSNYQELIIEATKDMIFYLKYLDSHEYILQDDQIGYKMYDGVSFGWRFGYYTMWTYYKEHENNRISKQSLARNIGIDINCGEFSYAEMPNYFTHIMGVTGTLKTLGHHEKNIIENDYNIRNYSYMPSVFGENNRSFRENADIHIENDKENYFQRIIEEINSQIIGKKQGERAILIFFETSEKLMDFYNNSNPSWKRFHIQIVTEDLRSGDRYRLINQATISGYVSLFTRVFGRGIDFKCQNHTVESNGGVHVIQSFLSEEASEETQIMGRSARQGQQGSFSMVLLAEELQKFQISDIDISSARDNATIYELLRQKRNEFYETKNSNENKHVKYVKETHDRSMEFLNNITQGNLDGFKSFILEQNISNFTENSYNIIILLQATESMSHLLQNAKNTIGIIFKRTREILVKKGVSSGCFQIKYCIYRTTSCPPDLIFQASPWSNKPEVLESFIKEARTQGGKGNEAINKALKYINDRYKHENISQVILIGDFENSPSSNPFNHQFSKKEKHKQFQSNSMENYHEELAKAARNCIPIHGFYTSQNSRNAFEEIGETTRGTNAFLDINSYSGAENLSNAICKEILRLASGEDAVKLYQRQYEMASFNRGFYSVYR